MGSLGAMWGLRGPCGIPQHRMGSPSTPQVPGAVSPTVSPLSPHSLAYLEKMCQEQQWLVPRDAPWPSLVTYRNSLQPQEEGGLVSSRSTAPGPAPGSAAKRPRVDGEAGAEPRGTPCPGGCATPSTQTGLCGTWGGACPTLSLAGGTWLEAGTSLRLPSTERGSLRGGKLRGGKAGFVSVPSPLLEPDCPREGMATRTGLKDGDRVWGRGDSSGTGIGCGDGAGVPVLSPPPAAPSERPDSSPWPSSRLPSPALTSTMLRGGPRPPARDPGSDPSLLQR